jgi:hypothetical protein
MSDQETNRIGFMRGTGNVPADFDRMDEAELQSAFEGDGSSGENEPPVG